jgi:hypothetical protein
LINNAPGHAFLREIADLLKHKREIDEKRQGAGLAMASYEGWLAEAMALLLMIGSVRSNGAEDASASDLTMVSIMKEIIDVRLRLEAVEALQEKIAKGLGVG